MFSQGTFALSSPSTGQIPTLLDSFNMSDIDVLSVESAWALILLTYRNHPWLQNEEALTNLANGVVKISSDITRLRFSLPLDTLLTRIHYSHLEFTVSSSKIGRNPETAILYICNGNRHLFLIGAMMKTHALPATSSTSVVTAISPANQGMAAMLYIYVCFYSMGWGPLPWVYVSDIFPTRTRHYGLAVASASQWLWIASLLISRHQFHLTFFCRQDFVVSHQTLLIEQHLGFKFFLMFATVNIGAMGTFSLLIPETKGRSLEEMDIIFGSVSAEKRSADVAKFEHALDNGPEIGSTRSNDYSDTKA
ncbi:general substrate transporter [Lentinula edodes]|uniref:General substrate transporter n=1 Tax=Lentinula edodes TaxID=5353 RepID=A0A1Q3EBL4_LENED|nr:general substrate transporter [Lentinula edodes]